MKYEVKTYAVEGNEKIVGFMVESDSGHKFAIDKRIPISLSKTDEDYMNEALALSKDEIDAWLSHASLVGKSFDPVTGKFI